MLNFQDSNIEFLECAIQAIAKMPNSVTRQEVGCSDKDCNYLITFYHLVHDTAEYEEYKPEHGQSDFPNILFHLQRKSVQATHALAYITTAMWILVGLD